jgi:hypothetical protein
MKQSSNVVALIMMEVIFFPIPDIFDGLTS